MKTDTLIDMLARNAGQGIRIADHCYGCTAGQGSSCGGALEPAVAAGAAAAAAPQTEEAR